MSETRVTIQREKKLLDFFIDDEMLKDYPLTWDEIVAQLIFLCSTRTVEET